MHYRSCPASPNGEPCAERGTTGTHADYPEETIPADACRWCGSVADPTATPAGTMLRLLAYHIDTASRSAYLTIDNALAEARPETIAGLAENIDVARADACRLAMAAEHIASRLRQSADNVDADSLTIRRLTDTLASVGTDR